MGQEVSAPQLPERIQSFLPVYRAAVPFIAKMEARTGFGGTMRAVDVEQYPETVRPWKPEDLNDVNIYLPLGEGESIDDKLYRFVAKWDGTEWKKPLHISDIHFGDYSGGREKVIAATDRRYRPIERAKNGVIRCKFEFQPFRAHPSLTDRGTAPIPEFLDPIMILTAQLKVFINGSPYGFDVHFSRDGEKWYPPGRYGQIPYRMLPFETLYVRMATESGKPITSASLDFEAILETPGFRGTGETVLAPMSRTTGEHQKAVQCPLAFRDDKGDLVLVINNNEDEPLITDSFFAHRYSTREGFLSGGGSRISDGAIVGPTIPAKSLGVFNLTIPKDQPGEHSFIFGFGGLGFHFTFSCPGNGSVRPQSHAGVFLGKI